MNHLAVASLALLACATAALGASPVPITNAGFEDPVVADGIYNDSDTIPGWNQFNGADLGVWNVSTVDLTAKAPEGSNVAYVYQATAEAGLSQTLSGGTGQLQADASYGLTVQVCNTKSIDGFPGTYSMRRGTVISLNGNNASWSGGFVANNVDLIASNYSRVRADNGGFGTGTVTINNGISLEILSGRGDTIDNAAALHINGTGRPDIRKLALNSNETVGQFWLDGVQQAAGAYTSASGLLDSIGNPLIAGTGTLTVLTGPGATTPYATWAATNAPTGNPDADYDKDGVSNAVEFVLGGGKDTNDLGKLPVAANDGTNMTFTFVRDQASIDAATVVTIEGSSDLSDWSETYAVPDGAAANNPGVTVSKNSPATGKDTVTLTLAAPDAKKFARLKVVITP